MRTGTLKLICFGAMIAGVVLCMWHLLASVSEYSSEPQLEVWNKFLEFRANTPLYIEPSFSSDPLSPKTATIDGGLINFDSKKNHHKISYVFKLLEKVKEDCADPASMTCDDSFWFLEGQAVFAAMFLARRGQLKGAMDILGMVCDPVYDVMASMCTADTLNNYAVFLAHADKKLEAGKLLLDLIHVKKSKRIHPETNLKWVKSIMSEEEKILFKEVEDTFIGDDNE